MKYKFQNKLGQTEAETEADVYMRVYKAVK